ncbi:MAG TPA: chromate transporter [Vicinamibacterales bacterium]|nr:chromate transporter [Vicinamibacterales bacterium]
MNVFVLYLFLAKATLTSFSGMASLPQIRQDLVATHHVLTDNQLSQAVLVGRATPGPMGAYVVAVGYQTAGLPGAVAGWCAMVTPAFLAIPLFAWIQRRLHHPRMRSLVDTVIITGAALLLPPGLQLALDALRQIARVAGY